MESGIGAVSVKEALVAVTTLVLDVAHLMVDGDEVLGTDPEKKTNVNVGSKPVLCLIRTWSRTYKGSGYKVMLQTLKEITVQINQEMILEILVKIIQVVNIQEP